MHEYGHQVGALCDYRPKRLAPLAISYLAKERPNSETESHFHSVIAATRASEGGTHLQTPDRHRRMFRKPTRDPPEELDPNPPSRVAIRSNPCKKCPMPLVISIHRHVG